MVLVLMVVVGASNRRCLLSCCFPLLYRILRRVVCLDLLQILLRLWLLNLQLMSLETQEDE